MQLSCYQGHLTPAAFGPAAEEGWYWSAAAQSISAAGLAASPPTGSHPCAFPAKFQCIKILWALLMPVSYCNKTCRCPILFYLSQHIFYIYLNSISALNYKMQVTVCLLKMKCSYLSTEIAKKCMFAEN